MIGQSNSNKEICWGSIRLYYIIISTIIMIKLNKKAQYWANELWMGKLKIIIYSGVLKTRYPPML